MAAITLSSRPVYRAPTKGRDYLTARAAAKNEADAMLNKQYPREHPEYEQGFCYFSGWHWTQDKDLVRAHARLVRFILRSFRAAQRAQAQKELSNGK
ncbi:hypothetical protein [Comamonas sp. HJ-2]